MLCGYQGQLRQPIFSIDNSRENDKISMLQHIEFEGYVNKHHIWLLEKKETDVKQSVITIQ